MKSSIRGKNKHSSWLVAPANVRLKTGTHKYAHKKIEVKKFIIVICETVFNLRFQQINVLHDCISKLNVLLCCGFFVVFFFLGGGQVFLLLYILLGPIKLLTDWHKYTLLNCLKKLKLPGVCEGLSICFCFIYFFNLQYLQRIKQKHLNLGLLISLYYWYLCQNSFHKIKIQNNAINKRNVKNWNQKINQCKSK